MALFTRFSIALAGALLTLVLLTAVAKPLNAETPKFPDKCAEERWRDYGESSFAMGLSQLHGQLVIVRFYANVAEESWTVVVTNTAGVCQIVATGVSFQFRTLEQVPEGPRT